MEGLKLEGSGCGGIKKNSTDTMMMNKFRGPSSEKMGVKSLRSFDLGSYVILSIRMEYVEIRRLEAPRVEIACKMTQN